MQALAERRCRTDEQALLEDRDGCFPVCIRDRLWQHVGRRYHRGPRSVPTELIMNRSVTDDRAVPSRSSISRSDAVRPPSSQYPPAVPDRSKYQPASQRSVFQSCARLLGGVGAVH